LTFGILSVFQTGLHPKLVKVLTKHSALAQNTSNAEAVYHAFSKLLSYRNAYTAVQVGRLPEAVKAVDHVESLDLGVPDFLEQTQIIEDLKVNINLFCGA
jgi:centromere/kinetochore protein ZW10